MNFLSIIKKTFFLPVFYLLLSACTNNSVFDEQRTLPKEGWHKDSACVFLVPIQDTISTYSVFVNIRNNKDYKYQNFWLFVNCENPDKTTKQDTIECYLADNEGKWLGSGIGSLRQISVLLDSAFVFNQAGTYQISLQQAMRDTTLVGINDIGLEIIKNTKR